MRDTGAPTDDAETHHPSRQVDQAERGEPTSGAMPIARPVETRGRLPIGACETIEDIRFRVRSRFVMDR